MNLLKDPQIRKEIYQGCVKIQKDIAKYEYDQKRKERPLKEEKENQ